MVWEDAHSDWRAGILDRARPEDVADVKKILSEGKPAPEITIFNTYER